MTRFVAFVQWPQTFGFLPPASARSPTVAPVVEYAVTPEQFIAHFLVGKLPPHVDAVTVLDDAAPDVAQGTVKTFADFQFNARCVAKHAANVRAKHNAVDAAPRAMPAK